MMTLRGRGPAARIAILLSLLAAGGSTLLTAGCSGGKASQVEDIDPSLRHARLVVPPVPDRHPYGDVSKVQVGQWATYKEGERTITLAAVGKEGDSVWIEKIDEGDPRLVSARRVDPEGVVLEAWYGEIARDGWQSTVERQTLEQAASVPPRPAESGRETGEETVAVSGRSLKAVKIRLRYEDLEGRLTEEVALWHPDVPPLYAGSEHGGLVRRQTGGVKVELTAFGADAKPLLKRAP